MPIYSPTGNLDITNATLRTSNIETQNIKINNVAISAAHNLQQVTSIGNATTNTIEFNNSTTSLTTASNVTVGNNLTVSGNIISNQETTLAGNVTVGKNILLSSNTTTRVDSNVVVEHFGPHKRHPVTPVLKKFPDVDFTQGKFDYNDSTRTYTQAGYVVSASSQSSGSEVWRLFDDGEWDQEAIIKYTSASSFQYNPTSNPNALGGVDGEWFKVEFPRKVIIDKIILNAGDAPNPGPKTFKVLGSDNDADWQVVKEVTASYSTSAPYKTAVESVSSTAFRYYAVVITQLMAATQVSIREVEFYGYEEDPPAGDTSVDTTFTSVMNTPQTGGVKVYVDGPTLENKITTGPTPTSTGATYDSTGKYWSITSNISVEANTFMSGDQPHAVSVWFNSSNLEANVSNTCVFSISDQEKLDSQNLNLQSNTWHNLTYAYQGEGGSRVTYLDGRKVSEDQAEDTFGEYPPFAMTGYSQGGYVVSASYEYNISSDSATDHLAWEAFDKSGDVVGWFSSTLGNYNGTNGTVTPTSTVRLAPETEKGEWLQLEFPYLFRLNYFVLYVQSDSTTTNTPDDFILYAKKSLNDTWTSLGTHNNTAAGQTSAGYTGIVNANETYKYFAVVVTKRYAQDANGGVSIRELKYYGHRENDLVRLPDPTRVLKYPHIAMTGPAQRGYVASASSLFNNGTDSNYQVWKPFDGSIANDVGAWISLNSPATYSSGIPTGTDSLTGIDSSSSGGVTERPGSYLKLKLPYKIKLSEARLYGRYQANTERIDAGYIYGSNDDVNWTQIGEISTSGISSGNLSTYDENNPLIIISTDTTNYYKYFIVQPTSLTHTYGYVGIGQMEYYGTEEATPVPIQIGGGNIDKVANFRVYDKFVGEDQALEIWDAQKDEFGRAKSSMTLHKGRLGLGTEEPEGRLAVLDEPHNLEEFPPRAMTADETYFEGHGVFKASVSTTYGNYAGWNVFDNDLSDFAGTGNQSVWHNAAGEFTGATPGVYQGSNELGGNYGSWLKLELPYKIKPSHIEIHPRGYSSGYVENYSQNPKDFKILASNDDVYWDTLTTQTDAYFEGGWKRFNIPADKHYKYFAFIGTKTVSGAYLALREIRYFGTREQGQSVLHDGQLTLTKNLNVPRIGPPFDADDTPRRDRLVVEYNTSTNPTFEGVVRDTSGRGNDGNMHGNVSYDPSDKAFTFDGVDDMIDIPIPRYMLGDPELTVSIWVKPQTIPSGSWDMYAHVGRNTNSQQIQLTYYDSSGGLHIGGYDQNIQVTGGYTLNSGRWYHLCMTIKPGAWSTSLKKLYVNGYLVSGQYLNGSGTTNISDDDRSRISFGGLVSESRTIEHEAHCFMSNMKVYDTALTAEEVKTLYNMGRLGNTIKTPLQIEAPVDIRGDIRYITNIRPLPKQTMWDHEANGHFTRGIYPITGTQGGSKVYNMLCEPDWCGGGWMCAAQIPRGKDVITTTINLFEDEYGDPSNLTWSSDFAVPINIFSNNSGYDLDVMLVVVGGTKAGRAGAGGARNGGIYRGVNLTQALNTGWPTNGVYPVNISTSGLASSADGYNFVSRTPSGYNFQPYKANTGWRLSFASKENYDMSYNDADINTMGWLVHTDGNILQYTYSYVHGGGGSQSNIADTSWAAVRFFVRPKRY